jgi:D-glycero-D-manno-heptose 1,7-bisphosphate phosphatase
MTAESRRVVRAVFLDRDGTIARDVNYCRRVEDFELLPTVPRAIRLLNENYFKVVVITNQSGIARGFFSEAVLGQINRHMERELARENARLDAVYYCPHHPDEGCPCRKPQPGLLLKAAAQLGISLKDSFMVGDNDKDVAAGRAAGCRTVLVTTGPDDYREITAPCDYIAGDLLQAARWIIDNTR